MTFQVLPDAVLAFPTRSRTDRPSGELSEFFAPERSVQLERFEEALAACATTFHYSRSLIAVEQLFLEEALSPEGTFTLRSHSRAYTLTEKAFDDLCALVELPADFAKRIPTDLIAAIVERLKYLHQQTAVLIARDATIVGIVNPAKWAHSRAKVHRPHYLPVGNAQLLRAIERSWNDLGEPPRISLADSGLRVELLDRRLALEPEVGDITRVGLTITGSETGGPMPQARGYTLRLICSNGATVPERFGLLRFDTDWRVRLETRLRAFELGLRGFAVDLGLLRATYARLVDEFLPDHLFSNLHRQVRYIYRQMPYPERVADTVVGVTAEHRQELVARVRQRQAELRAGATLPQATQPTGLRSWQVFNSVTAAAREETHQRRLALERLAGDMLQVYAPASSN